MPNYSTGILYVAGKNPNNILAFACHGMDRDSVPLHIQDSMSFSSDVYSGTSISFWGRDAAASLEYLGDGKYIGRFQIECSWSCVGNVLSNEAPPVQRGYTYMDLTAQYYDVGFVIEAEENSFSEIISCTNTGTIDYEQPDMHYYSKNEDEHGSDAYCEVKYQRSHGWYVVDNGEVVEDAMRQDAQYFVDKDMAIELAISLGAEVY